MIMRWKLRVCMMYCWCPNVPLQPYIPSGICTVSALNLNVYLYGGISLNLPIYLYMIAAAVAWCLSETECCDSHSDSSASPLYFQEKDQDKDPHTQSDPSQHPGRRAHKEGTDIALIKTRTDMTTTANAAAATTTTTATATAVTGTVARKSGLPLSRSATFSSWVNRWPGLPGITKNKFVITTK